MIRASIILVALFAPLSVLAAEDAPAPPRPFTLTAQQAQDYANYLQSVMKQAEQQYAAAKSAMDDLTAQTQQRMPDLAKSTAPADQKKK